MPFSSFHHDTLHLFPFLFYLFALFFPFFFFLFFIFGGFSIIFLMVLPSLYLLSAFFFLRSPSTQAAASLPSTYAAKPGCSPLFPLTEPTITNTTSSLLPLTEPTITNPSSFFPDRTHNHKPNCSSSSSDQTHSSLPDRTQKPIIETHLLISKPKIQGRGLSFHLGQTEAPWV